MPESNSPLPPRFLWGPSRVDQVSAAAAAAQLAERDPALGRIIARVGPPTLAAPPIASPVHYLQRSIVYQQLSGKAAATIYRRFVGLYRGRPPTAEQVLTTTDASLRGAGLSAAKARAIRDLAHHHQAGRIPPRALLYRLDHEAIVERLTAVKGIGRWTVEMLLIFYLGHADVLPLGDLGVKKGYQRVYGKRRPPSPEALRRHGERWRPYRSVASWYLWRALELPPD
jgi:DNA-3-methyladenine glycosylase II